MTPKITEFVGVPEIGQFFLVPTLRGEWCNRKGIWPVLGPMHEDAEFLQFPHDHWHLDARFMNVAEWRHAARYSVTRSADSSVAALPLMKNLLSHGDEIYWQRRAYRRHFQYPLTKVSVQQHFQRLHAQFEGVIAHRGEHGLVCPHRGAPLGSIAPNERGHIVCPLHGLCWDAATGRNIRDPLAVAA